MADAHLEVLYVEDEEFDRFLMQRAFAKAGLANMLRMVKDGNAAVELLAGCSPAVETEHTCPPSLVLLDLNLPEMPGFEVLKWIRSQPHFATLPVVIFSSSEREDDQIQARELGANGFIKKPASGFAFSDVVQEISERWLTPAAYTASQPAI